MGDKQNQKKLLQENKCLRRDLKKAQEAMGRFEFLKARMLKIISHDLRTPLSCIRGYSELLRSGIKGPITDAQKKMLDITVQEADHLNGLIGDVLDMSLLDAGQLNLDTQPVPFHELIQKALPRLQLASELKEIPLENRLDLPLPVVEADVTRMVQVIVNILRGLLKYAPKGGRVILSAVQTGRMLELRLSQDGRGVASEQLEKLFKAAEASPTGKTVQDGLQIALALALAIVKLHNGKMGMESGRQSNVTTFWIRLPILKETSNT
ncbi:MAG: HAMP domain-containing sensor histidine kinase [Elusimicrobiota bacterium]|jgi:signal transduction histidine kinase